MAIFGFTNYSIMGYIYRHDTNDWDKTMNIGYGISITISFIIAIITNPIVFVYNYKAKFSLGSLLFMLMSSLDIIQNIIRPVHQLVQLWSPNVTDLVLLEPQIPSSEIVVTVSVYIVCQASISMVCILGVVRYIQIKCPFWSYSHERQIMVATISFVVCECVYNACAITLPMFINKVGGSFNECQRLIHNYPRIPDK